MTKSERLAATGKGFEENCESKSSQSESEDKSSSDSLSDQSSSDDITGEEDSDIIGDDYGCLDEVLPENTNAVSQEAKETCMSPSGNICNKRRALPRSDREEIPDSGIESMTSVPSEGSCTDTDDLSNYQKKQLLSRAPGGSFDDNVFTCSDE